MFLTKVLEKLQEKGVLDDTLVIYTADHGLSVGHHGFWGHGEDTWPSNMHRSANNIPLIFSYPDFASFLYQNPGARREWLAQQEIHERYREVTKFRIGLGGLNLLRPAF